MIRRTASAMLEPEPIDAVDDTPDTVDDAPTPFAAWLRRELHATRMSQRQLARRSGVNHSTISRLLSDPREPTYRTAYRLAKTLGALSEAPPIERDEGLLDRGPSALARVEHALRADPVLRGPDVRELMRGYLRLRTRRLAGVGSTTQLRRVDALDPEAG